ncbi:MAG: DUF1573 domain-containing protein [Bacteroidota bacterium]|nr:DUF1573 domain-containing protein [Bacteroidota bacterium]
MKNSLLVLVMVLFASLSMQAQVSPTSVQDSIVFDKMAHDYGTIVQGSDGNCEFKFVNKGKAPIILNEVKASCGCTSPDWTRTPVAPGETGTIKVAYNTNIAGAFNKTVTVNSNAKNTPVILLVKGIVTAKQ